MEIFGQLRRVYLEPLRGLLFIATAACLMSLPSVSRATIYDVTQYGAIGDCTQFWVMTTSNSATVVTTNLLGAGAVGKTMELFGAGPMGTYMDTNSTVQHQDMAVTITAVNGHNVTVSSPAGCSSNHILCTFGTNNGPVFQSVVNMANNGDTILIPAGNYLMLAPEVLDPAYIMATYANARPAFIVSKGGLSFQGAGTNTTILTGCGAWQNRGAFGMRGFIVWLQGPVVNDGPIVFNGITFDGGVKSGRTGYDYWPVRISNGDGWDVTHGAIMDTGLPPLPQNVTIQSCSFVHWRGEVLKSVAAGDGYRLVTNCYFYDGNATAFNFSYSHRIDNCYFDTFKGAMEFYQGYSTQPSYFVNSVVTNIQGVTGGSIGMVIVGAVAGRVQPPYTISNDVVSAAASDIYLDPAQNVNILNNSFVKSGLGVYFGAAGYQGTTNTGNILIQGNTFSNVYAAICMYGSPTAEAPHDIYVTSNLMQYPGGNSQFACGLGWCTNVYFSHNTAAGVTFGLYGSSLQGQWFKDDISDEFPYFVLTDRVGVTNTLTYGNGMRQAPQPLVPGSVFKIDDSSPGKIPPGAVMIVQNQGTQPARLYTSTTLPVSALLMTNGYAAAFAWTNGMWQNVVMLQPPGNLHIIGQKN